VAPSGVRNITIKSDTSESFNNDTISKPAKITFSLRDSIVDFGMGLLGTPYAEGACNRDGFDCSGFVYYVFQHFNIRVPRSSSQFSNFGKEIAIDSVRKGDILIFLSPTRNVIGHVGIVINPMGMESDFIHASSGNEMKVIISSLKQQGYKLRFVKVVNVL
jgi:cell wall-associated NlpC family hydrolase